MIKIKTLISKDYLTKYFLKNTVRKNGDNDIATGEWSVDPAVNRSPLYSTTVAKKCR